MTPDSIETAIVEAKRFLEKADRVRISVPQKGYRIAFGPKETGALRRASMDLTRALAEMRKP